MPAFSEFFFFTDFGFLFFCRDEDNSKADSSLCCPSPFSLSLCEFVPFLLCISALFFFLALALRLVSGFYFSPPVAVFFSLFFPL